MEVHFFHIARMGSTDKMTGGDGSDGSQCMQANTFVKLYGKVKCLKFSKKDRSIKKLLNGPLQV